MSRLRLDLDQRELPPAARSELSFRILGSDGTPVTDFEVEHEKRIHLIVVRRDLSSFQHLHPEMRPDGTWSTLLTLPEAGVYRVFADFNHKGEGLTLSADLAVDGEATYRDLPEPAGAAATDGYDVRLAGGAPSAGEATELTFEVTRNGDPVQVEPYLGASGHLVALREGDLAYLHVHPAGHGGHGAHEAGHDDAIRFHAEFPSEGRHRLFLQFKHEGDVHTADFTIKVGGTRP